MTSLPPSREEALTLLRQYNQNEALIHHALAVEAVMRYLARKHGGDEGQWGIIGLIHDLDYEKFLYTIDELTGLVAAAALVRPSKSVLDLEVKSVKKKWKQKNFAAGVNREVIEKGARMLGKDLDELIHDVIMGLREVADQIGL